ncbi:hypothetical protein [Actinomycetospora soli]|uniref:hypothetical protein n=1 Tax=Actinomycetospora soli TaxID=2893887 RepID=UPI001E3290D5|nr:hypothetical protein [Actinomycetospora soli]MCD2191156.1 hypothetical protein [Actinomycetospora soli]
MIGALLRRRWRALVVGALLGAGVGLLVADVAAASGDLSTSQVLLSAGIEATRGSAASASTNQYVNQRMATDAELVTSDVVLFPAARELGMTVEALSSQVRASAPDDASTITIEVRGSSPESARRAAEAVTTSAVRVLPVLETPDAGQAARSSTQVVRQPSLPPGRPSLLLATVTGALGGLVLAALGAAVLASGPVRRTVARVRAWTTAQP